MRTATIDAILGPVAEAVGELLLANEEAELNDVPLPDLTGVALVVGQSVQNLLNIAKDVPNKTEVDERDSILEHSGWLAGWLLTLLAQTQ